MPLRLVVLQYAADPRIQLRVDRPQAVGDILVNRGFGYMKLPSGSTHCRVVFDDVFAQFNCPLLNCSLHAITS